MIKFPKIKHLPSSPGISRDDKVLSTDEYIRNNENIVYEKMDGSNVSIRNNKIWGRSLDNDLLHPSYNLIKQFHKNNLYFFKDKYPEMTFVFENMTAVHSIDYGTRNINPFYLLMIYKNDKTVLRIQDTFTIMKLLDENLQHPQTLTHHVRSWTYDNWMPGINRIVNDERNNMEGYVIRNRLEFDIKDFDNNIAKYVRANHVQPEQQRWEKNWKKQNYKGKQ